MHFAQGSWRGCASIGPGRNTWISHVLLVPDLQQVRHPWDQLLPFGHQHCRNAFFYCGKLINPLNAELNPICHLLELLGAHHFLHVSRIRVKSLTLRLLMSYMYIYIYTFLDEWSARRKDLYLTSHNTHNRQISVPPVGFEPTISAGERPQTYALDRAATGTGVCYEVHQRCTVHLCHCFIKCLIKVMYKTSQTYYEQRCGNYGGRALGC